MPDDRSSGYKHEAEHKRVSLELSSEVCLESFVASPGVQGLQPKAIKFKAGGHHSESTCALLAGDQGMCISRHSSGQQTMSNIIL